MAKKKRKGHPQGKPSSALKHVDKATLTQDAQKALEQGRFREAIAHYKTLLKQEETTQSRQGLADAYEGRAMALSDKGMDKEALVIWENRQALGGDVAPMRLLYADALLRVGKASDVAALLHTGNDALSRVERDGLRARLAAHSLAGNTHIRDALPESDPLHTHLDAAEAALNAYCRGDDDALTQALAAIPFRSPCRDLVHILKALQRLEEAPEDAKSRLAKVPHDSAFASLKLAAELACLPESALASQLHDVGEATRRFVLTLRGWDNTRQTMQQALQKIGPAPSAKALFNLMYRYQQTLGKAWVEEYSLRLLVDQFPDSAQWLRQKRPVQPPNYDLLRLLLWYMDTSNADPWDVLDSLERLADELLMQVPVPGSDHELRIALTLKRIDTGYRLLDATPSKDPDALDRHAAAFVEESLAYDPDDLEPYLRLHAYYLRGKKLKQARYYQEQALSRWPSDVRVLTAALDTALASQAFKKAAKLAHQILTIDPINRYARERLVKAHLAHAAKQLRAGRPDLAAKELDDATQWDTQGRFEQRRDIIAALIETQRDSAAGKVRLNEVHQRQGGGLTAHFNLASELLDAGIPPSQIAQRFGIKKVHVQGTADMEAFVAQLQARLVDGKLPDALKRYFEKPVKSAAFLPLTFDAMLQLCELLKRCNWEAPRLAVAREGVKQWKAPIFELHAFEAKYPNKHFLASEQDIRRLEAAETRATETGDVRTAARLNEILAGFRFLGMGESFFDEMPGLFDEHDDMLDDSCDSPMDNPFASAAEQEALLADLRERGLDAVCDDLGLTGQPRKVLRAMKRDFGLEAVAAFLSEMMMDMGGE